RPGGGAVRLPHHRRGAVRRPPGARQLQRRVPQPLALRHRPLQEGRLRRLDGPRPGPGPPRPGSRPVLPGHRPHRAGRPGGARHRRVRRPVRADGHREEGLHPPGRAPRLVAHRRPGRSARPRPDPADRGAGGAARLRGAGRARAAPVRCFPGHARPAPAAAGGARPVRLRQERLGQGAAEGRAPRGGALPGVGPLWQGRPMTPTPHSVPGRARGALLAGAVGDALGWPYERPSHDLPAGHRDAAGFFGWRRTTDRFRPFTEEVAPGEYSDDTQLTIAVARARLAAGPEWAAWLERVELPFLSCYESGAGATVKRACRSWASGRPPWAAAPKDRARYFAGGANGVAMRVAPHAIAHHAEDGFAELARDV